MLAGGVLLSDWSSPQIEVVEGTLQSQQQLCGYRHEAVPGGGGQVLHHLFTLAVQFDRHALSCNTLVTSMCCLASR